MTDNTDPYNCDGLDLGSLAQLYMDTRSELDDHKAQTASVQKKFDYIRKVALPRLMEDMGIDTVTVKGLGRVSIRAELYASIPVEHREEAYAWLEEHGYGDLINPTVNSSSFKAFCKEAMRQGEELPSELFKIEPFDMATITKT